MDDGTTDAAGARDAATADAIPPRLRPFLAQWDYMVEMLTERLAGMTDAEYLWEPAPEVWTVRLRDGRTVADAEVWAPTGGSAPPRTLAWTIGHLATGVALRADWLVGEHRLMPEDVTWPLSAADGVAQMLSSLAWWRNGLATMSDEDLDTVGRSAWPHGLDPELPLMEIVWWVSKELLFHAAEAWYVRDLYAALDARTATR